MKAEEANKISGPIGNADLTGKTVVIASHCLAPEYRNGDRRLICVSGSGCDIPALNKRKALYGIFQGEAEVRFDRCDIEGLAAHPLKAPARQRRG